ncbi:ABC transporter permease [Aquirufa aurantiipilula]|uniref:ABC transporter permease n=1 Tax=Aquirufa aurantiipilula TaxID=2696561 RepID=UPI0021D4400B|nr:FtsX-like permease family protein [Aquirufa aurantiipilula]
MAWRNIWRNKSRSMVIILSVALGLFAGIMVQALYKGMMRDRIKSLIYTEVGHIQIHEKEFKKDFEPSLYLQHLPSLIQQIKRIPQVKAFATRSIAQGMLASTTGSSGIQMNGINPEQENVVSSLKNKLIAGSSFQSQKKNQLLIGKKLAKKMKLDVGNKIVLTCSDQEGNMVSSAFKIAGIFQSTNSMWDERNVFILQSNLNDMLGIPGESHEIVLLLHQDELATPTQQILQKQFKNLAIETWKELSPETDLMVSAVDITSYIIMGIILFALAFGIINTMLMAILERTREIGMMMALGMNKVKLFFLVLLETTFLTIGGVPIGYSSAWLLNTYLHKSGLNWKSMGEEMMRSFGFSSTIYPEFPTDKIAGTITFVLITAFISCLYPAIKALQLQPVEALRK